MGSNTTTTKLVTLDKSKEIVAIFAGVQQVSDLMATPDELASVLNALSRLEEAPSCIEGFTLEQVKQAAEMVRYFCISVPQN